MKLHSFPPVFVSLILHVKSIDAMLVLKRRVCCCWEPHTELNICRLYHKTRWIGWLICPCEYLCAYIHLLANSAQLMQHPVSKQVDPLWLWAVCVTMLRSKAATGHYPRSFNNSKQWLYFHLSPFFVFVSVFSACRPHKTRSWSKTTVPRLVKHSL